MGSLDRHHSSTSERTATMNGFLLGFLTLFLYLGCIASIVYFSQDIDFDIDLLSFCSEFHGFLVAVMPSIYEMSFGAEEMEDEKTALLWGVSLGCMLGVVLVNLVPWLDLGDGQGVCYGGDRLLEVVATIWGW